MMPNRYWFWEFSLCDDFGPDGNKNRLQPSGHIHCRDADSPAKHMLWSYAGKSQIEGTEDMAVPQMRLKGDRLLVQWQPS